MALPPEGYALADAGRGGRAAAASLEAPRLQISVTNFERSKSGQVMAIPPRSQRDEDLYLETYGRAYDGPFQGRWREQAEGGGAEASAAQLGSSPSRG
jgi:hypothetical protein